MIHDFYHNTRAEIKELEAKVKNLDTDMQSMEEQHRTQIKVFMQKVKHLEYEHSNNCDRVKIDAHKKMRDERTEHTNRGKEKLAAKATEKEGYIRDDMQNQGDIETTEKDLDGTLKTLVRDLNFARETLIDKYEKKLQDLREELELRMKVEVHEIEERKNQHINELMKNHEEAFREMKDYHNDITRENLEMIRMSKEKLVDIRNQIETNQVTVEHLKLKMIELQIPLANAINARDTLEKQLANFDKDVMALRNAKARLQVLKNKEK